MPILLDLFLTFLEIGVVSFGGGYAMIPLITDKVISHGWLTNEQVLNFIAVSESTPGPIAVNMATFIGSSQGGVLGAFLATLGVVLPSFIIIFVIASLITGLLKYAGVKSVLSGIRPVVVGLIVATGITMFMLVVAGITTVKDGAIFDWKALVIFLTVAIISIGYKLKLKKSISPILLIILSAIMGIIFYGLI